MKAIRVHTSGPPKIIQLDEINEPNPQNHEVKVHVCASSLNHLDIWVRQGKIPLTYPRILGSDASGKIVEVGSGVSSFKVGDKVILCPGMGCNQCAACLNGFENHCLKYQIFGAHRDGTHCETICVPENRVLPLPSTLTFNEGAAFPLVFLTAWHMLITKGQLQKGETILIMAGASGLGSAAIQIAKWRETRIITTVGSDDKKSLLRQFGAHHIINHYKDDLGQKIGEYTDGRGPSLIFDHVGALVWPTLIKSLAKGGRLVFCGMTTGGEVNLNLRDLFGQQKSLIGSTMGTIEELKEIAQLMEKNKLKPVIHKVLSPEDIREGHEILEKGGMFGKIILNWQT